MASRNTMKKNTRVNKTKKFVPKTIPKSDSKESPKASGKPVAQGAPVPAGATASRSLPTQQTKRDVKGSRSSRKAQPKQYIKKVRQPPAKNSTADKSAAGQHRQKSDDQSAAKSASSVSSGKTNRKNKPSGKVPSTAGSGAPRIEIRRAWVFTPELLALVTELFPGYLVVSDQRHTPSLHSHPRSALERAIVEDSIYRDINRLLPDSNIVDIGGNPSRHYASKRNNIHSCCPVLDGADVLRNQRYNERMDYCTQTVQQCGKQADVYMSIHSLYYLSLPDVIDLVYKANHKVLYAAVHKFTNGYGKFHNNGNKIPTYESKYELAAPDEVHMSVTGNDHGMYIHDPLFWLEKTYHDDGVRAIAWGYRQMGDTYIYTFKPAPRKLRPNMLRQSLPMFESLKQANHDGPVVLGVEEYLPAMELLRLKKVKVSSFGPLFWLREEQSTVFVPKGLVEKVAFYLVGKPRDRDTWHLCVRETKNLLKKDFDIPSRLRVKLAIYVPAFAFIAFLADEVASFNTLLLPRHRRLFNDLSEAMSFQPYKWRLCCDFRSVFCLNRCCARVDRNTTEVETADMVTSEYEHSRVSLQVIRARAREAWAFTRTTSEAALKTMRKGAKLITYPVESKENKVGLYQLAPAFSGHIPIVAASNQENEIIALRNRVVCEVLKPDPKAWERIRKNRRERKPIDYQKIIDNINFDTNKAFVEWNSGFSGTRAAQQATAWAKLQKEPLETEHLIKKMFTKSEKLDKSHADGCDEWSPRAIQGSTHEANVVLSPFIAQYAKALAKQWNGKGKFYYTSGQTSVQIGGWFVRHYRIGDWVIEVDFSSYDGTQGKEVHEMIDNNFTNAGIDLFGEARTVFDAQTNVEGRTNHGVRYFVDNGMHSGRPDTSCSNTDTTVVAAEDTLEQVFGSSEDMHIAGMGDDNTTIVPARYMVGRDPREIERLLIEQFAKLGFSAKVKVTDDMSQIEFCSGVFWPCNVNGEESFVLGQKPGRALSKIGYSLVKHDLGTIKGMFLGHQAACSYVPVLRVYIDEVLRKLDSVTAKKYVDKEARFKYTTSHGDNICNSVMLGDFFEERYGLELKVVEDSLRELMRDAKMDTLMHWEYLDVLRAVDC